MRFFRLVGRPRKNTFFNDVKILSSVETIHSSSNATAAFLSASVDLPFKESNDSGLREYIRLTSPCREG